MTITPGSAVDRKFIALWLFFEKPEQVPSVPAALHALRQATEVGARDIAHAECDLLDARDLEPLPLLDRLHEVRRLQQGLVRSGVEPRRPASKPLDVQAAGAQIRPVQIGDLQL